MAATDNTSITGSDGVLYNATPAELKEKAGDIITTKETVAGELSALQNYVKNLEQSWGGIAADTFQALMVEWDQHAAQLQHALGGIAEGLQTTANNYTEGEHVNLANLNAVHLPPARLS
ncbi:WXG100 family type VII secretion target [Streptomyces sp. NBC_00178]|uniref:WXG100 family type VII secretion target n=1 Tax=Streptomyces sp. NBC_00178 TaxID=2975672 RepID=UPI002E2D8D22|nr:WXG100 family type VII secretion target [Streptomyces sp. NBC_00178]